ncbi:MAG TPA: hypothetical protein VFU47_11415, partial [Armatimonadota bacterium]|nr:hypothetical protein [Armatimonadota bacterium]
MMTWSTPARVVLVVVLGCLATCGMGVGRGSDRPVSLPAGAGIEQAVAALVAARAGAVVADVSTVPAALRQPLEKATLE